MTKEKDPILAAFLSFIIAGMGQVYVGDPGRGMVYLGCSLIIIFGGVYSLFVMNIFWLYIVFVIWDLGWVFHAMYDAYHTAKAVNE